MLFATFSVLGTIMKAFLSCTAPCVSSEVTCLGGCCVLVEAYGGPPH